MDRQLVITIRDAQTALTAEAGSTPKSYGTGAQYRPSAYARRIADAVASDYGLSWVAEWRIGVLGVHCVVLRAADERSRTETIRKLEQDARIESVQPMHRFHTTTSSRATYNDPYFRLQRQVELLRVPDAHRWSRGKGVNVAVIDTGVDARHPDLAGRVRLARNFVDDDAANFRRDAHGTAVAGVIAAASDNHMGIVGVAPEVRIMALKACWYRDPAQMDSAVCNTLTLAEALAFAIDQRAAVINLSLTGPSDPLLRRLVEAALKRGTVVVGADSGGANAASAFPVSVPGVLAVGDSDATAVKRRHARVTAPGRDVLTLTPFGRYDYLSGVSLSSAMVTGIVALLLERHRTLAPHDISRLIERTASPTSLSPTALLLVNACSAVASVTRAARCEEQITQTMH